MPCVSLDEPAIAKHLESHLGPCDGVLHALAGGCHVYHFAARPGREYQTIVTMGLSGTAMPVPSEIDDAADFAHVELMAYLPADWPFAAPGAAVTTADAATWPYIMLRSIAEYAVEARVWIGPLHGLTNLHGQGEPYVAGSLLTNALLVPPVHESPRFDRLRIDGKRVRFLVVIPLTAAEFELKLAAGFEGLVEHLESNAITSVINAKRPSAV